MVDNVVESKDVFALFSGLRGNANVKIVKVICSEAALNETDSGILAEAAKDFSLFEKEMMENKIAAADAAAAAAAAPADDEIGGAADGKGEKNATEDTIGTDTDGSVTLTITNEQDFSRFIFSLLKGIRVNTYRATNRPNVQHSYEN